MAAKQTGTPNIKIIQNSYSIYIDETTQGNSFSLAAAIVPFRRKESLILEWSNLRKKIKKHLLENYEGADKHKELQGDNLPEIHATDILGSRGLYRKKNALEGEEYWLKHREWLEEALSIARRNKVVFVGISFDDISIITEKSDTLSSRIDGLKSPRIKEKMDRLEKNPYVYALPLLLTHLENTLSKVNMYSEVVCDDYDECYGFPTLNALDWLIDNRKIRHIRRPRYASGKDEPLLQVADVLCFMLGHYLHAKLDEKNMPSHMAQWIRKFIKDKMLMDMASTNEKQKNTSLLMTYNLIVQMSVTNESLRGQIVAYILESLQDLHSDYNRIVN